MTAMLPRKSLGFGSLIVEVSIIALPASTDGPQDLSFSFSFFFRFPVSTPGASLWISFISHFSFIFAGRTFWFVDGQHDGQDERDLKKNVVWVRRENNRVQVAGQMSGG